MEYQDYQEMNKRMDMAITHQHYSERAVEAYQTKALADIALMLGQMLRRMEERDRILKDILRKLQDMDASVATCSGDVCESIEGIAAVLEGSDPEDGPEDDHRRLL